MTHTAEERELAHAMIEMHGAKAIAKAEQFLHYSAETRSRESASKWLRVMVLIEFSELRAAS